MVNSISDACSRDTIEKNLIDPVISNAFMVHFCHDEILQVPPAVIEVVELIKIYSIAANSVTDLKRLDGVALAILDDEVLED